MITGKDTFLTSSYNKQLLSTVHQRRLVTLFSDGLTLHSCFAKAKAKLKGKTQKPSSPMLMGHGKGEHTVLSPFNFSRNEKGEGKAGVTGRESFVFQQFIVLELLSS